MRQEIELVESEGNTSTSEQSQSVKDHEIGDKLIRHAVSIINTKTKATSVSFYQLMAIVVGLGMLSCLLLAFQSQDVITSKLFASSALVLGLLFIKKVS